MSEAQASAHKRRALVPREHGAYGQLMVPLACALLLGVRAQAGRGPGCSLGWCRGPGWSWEWGWGRGPGVGEMGAPLLLAAGFTLAFFAHESLLVLMGQRGARALAEDGERARHRLALLLGSALLLSSLGLLVAPPAVRLAVLIPVVLGAAAAVAAAWRLIKTTPGELLAAAALSSTVVPVALAGHRSWAAAMVVWLVFLVGFFDATLVVRALVGRLAGLTPRPASLLAAVLVTASIALAVPLLQDQGGLLLAASILPVSLLTLLVALLRPHPRHLRVVGWFMAGTTVVAGVLLLVAL